MARLTTCLLGVMLILIPSISGQEKKPAEKKELPEILYPIPLVAKPGATQKLVLRGRRLDGVKEITLSGAEGSKVKVLSSKKITIPNDLPAERLGDTEVEIELELPKNIKPGALKLNAVGANGPSKPYELPLADDTPRLAEKEPNDGFEQAQSITLPVAIDGVIRSARDVDVYRFEAKKGDVLHCEIVARRWGSPLDAMLSLYGEKRDIERSVGDTPESSDPKFSYRVTRDGPFYLVVMDAHDLGGPQFAYRLVVRKE